MAPSYPSLPFIAPSFLVCSQPLLPTSCVRIKWSKEHVVCGAGVESSVQWGSLLSVPESRWDQIQGFQAPDLSRSLWASLFGQGPIEKTGSKLGLRKYSSISWALDFLSLSHCLPLLSSSADLMVAHELNPSPAMTLSSLTHCPSDFLSWPWSGLFYP